MEEPRGEQFAFNFYFHEPSRADVFARLARCCFSHGGKFSGEILESIGIGSKDHRYSSIADRPVQECVASITELDEKLADRNVDVIKIGVTSATGLTNKKPEIITYCGVSSAAAKVDIPALAIIAEGWVFSTPGYEEQATKAGRKCTDRFLRYCGDLDPDYAAILNEDSLPCGADLALGEGRRCFLNYFVSERAYGSATITTIESLYKDSYIQRLATGVYISTWPPYNPRGVLIQRQLAVSRSVQVAQLLVRSQANFGGN
jgi:hypothetical protein